MSNSDIQCIILTTLGSIAIFVLAGISGIMGQSAFPVVISLWIFWTLMIGLTSPEGLQYS